jgi:hypothetical protein
MDRWHSGSPNPKNFRVQKPDGKLLDNIFWNQDGIILIDYLPKDQNIKSDNYSNLLLQMNDILNDKRRGNITNCVLFLHNNAPGHQILATQKNQA